MDDASRFGNYLGVDSVAPPESGSWHFLSLHIGACSYFLHSPTAHAVGCILRCFATSDQEDSRAIFAERIEFRPDCWRYEMSVLRFETGVEAPSCFRDAPWALGAWRFEYRSRAYHNAAWEFLKFGDSGFAPQPSSLATTTGAELCSACRGLRAAPTHDYSDAVDSFLPLR